MGKSDFFASQFSVVRTARIIDQHLPELLDVVEKNPVTVLTAGTSAGKTSRIPQALSLAYPNAHVWLSQPRRKAVRKNGGWIAREMGCRSGELVGWRLAGDEPVESRATRVHLRVDMALVNRIVQSGGELPEGFIIVDEAHERSIAIDLLLGLLKEALPRSPRTRVIISSATIDTTAFSKFFDNAPVIVVPGSGYPVRTEIVRLQRGEHHSQAATRAAENVLDKFLAGEPLIPNETSTEVVPVSKGTVLVLLPGKEDIDQAMRQIMWHAERQKAQERVEVLECHGETQSAADDLIDLPMQDGTIRFVCATEVVRTSVTIAEIIGVVDSCQVKRPIANAQGVVHLDKITISKAEADQGKGRAGRERPGFYMPASFESEFEGLKPHPTPAVVYSPLTSVALTIASMGKSIRTFPMLNRPEEARMSVAIERLQRLDLLDGQEIITAIGREVSRFSIEPESAKGYWMAEKLGVLPEAVIASAIVENEGVFFTPRTDADLFADEWLVRLVLSRCRKRMYGGWEVVSARDAVDPATIDLNDLPEWILAPGQEDTEDDEESEETGKNSRAAVAKNELYTIKPRTYGFPFEDGARSIALLVRRHFSPERSDFAAAVRMYRAAKRNKVLRQFLNGKKLGLVDHTIELLKEDLAGSPLSLNGGLYWDREFDGHALTKAVASGRIDNVLVRHQSAHRTSYHGALGEYISLGQSSVCPADRQVVLIGGVRKIDGRRGQFLLADTAAPIEPEWLVDVLPALCTLSDRDDHRYLFDSDQVIHTRDVKFGAVSMTMDVPTANAEQAARAFAQTVASGYVSTNPFSDANRRNREVQAHAEQLAVRCGGHTRRVEDKDIAAHYEAVFFIHSVVSRATWAAAEVEGLVMADELKLYLDDFVSPGEQERVTAGNPEQIFFMGSEREVRYVKGQDPEVTIAEDILEGDLWKNLPDVGLLLPSGRKVRLVLQRMGGQYLMYYADTNVPLLKEKIRKILNEQSWKAAEKPTIALPQPDRDEALTDVVECQYGLDALTSEPVSKFGTVAAQMSFNSFNGFVVQWLDDRTTAEERRNQAVEHFNRLQGDARERRMLAEAKEEAKPVEQRVKALNAEYEYSNVLPREVRDELRSRAWSWVPNTTVEVRQWMADHQAVIAKVEAVLAERQRREQLHYNYQEAVFALGAESHAHLLVAENGMLFVGATKHNSIGSLDVEPIVQDVVCDERVSLDDEGKVSRWQCISSGTRVSVAYYSGKGNLQDEVVFRSPEAGTLSPGVWTVAKDNQGMLFYPAIYYRDRQVVIPEEITVVRERQRPVVTPAAASGNIAAALVALKAQAESDGRFRPSQRQRRR